MGATVSSTTLEKANSAIPESPSKEAGRISGDEFLGFDDLGGFKQDAAQRILKQAIGDIGELIRENKWEDAVSLFHPVEDKFPELVVHDLDIGLREKVAFALGHLKKYDEAMSQLDRCIQKDPKNFHLHASMAYTAYDSLYAAKNREIFLAGKLRDERIRLAHRHFDAARNLRPEGVTNFYRQGMLYRQIEKKTEPALPLFHQAVQNWDKLEPAQQDDRHQEKKNFVKALFQLSGSLLDIGKAEKALPFIKRCLVEDEKTNYLSLCFKYFALGKVSFHLGQFNPAKDALLFALQCDGGQTPDFVCELLARTYLALGNAPRALETIRKIPEKIRKPYCRWTEADVQCALKNPDAARKALLSCMERDPRSRHKTLIRLSKIDYLTGDYASSLKWAVAAGSFYTEKWGNIFADGLFWQSVNTFRLGDIQGALKLARELRDINPRYPRLGKLLDKLEAG